MHIATRRKLAISAAVIGLFSAITFALEFRTKSQQLQSLLARDKESQQIENSADQPLHVLENDDSPMRILEAKVKEVSGTDFNKLTGQHSALATVCSVPQVQLLNSSGKVVTGFVLAIRDPTTKTTRGMVQSKILINQGEAYTVKRQAFMESEWTSTINNDGKIQSSVVTPNVHSEKYWISFASRAALFVTVVRVSFQDGSVWRIKEGGDIQ